MVAPLPWWGAGRIYLGKIILIFLVATNDFRNCVDSLEDNTK
jgi:hypothetical protein